MPTITPEDAKNILVLIGRTQLTGNEAQAVVAIQQKLMAIAGVPANSVDQTTAIGGNGAATATPDEPRA